MPTPEPESSSPRFPITILRDRAAQFAAVDHNWDDAAWERAWIESLRSRNHVIDQNQDHVHVQINVLDIAPAFLISAPVSMPPLLSDDFVNNIVELSSMDRPRIEAILRAATSELRRAVREERERLLLQRHHAGANY